MKDERRTVVGVCHRCEHPIFQGEMARFGLEEREAFSKREVYHYFCKLEAEGCTIIFKNGRLHIITPDEILNRAHHILDAVSTKEGGNE